MSNEPPEAALHSSTSIERSDFGREMPLLTLKNNRILCVVDANTASIVELNVVDVEQTTPILKNDGSRLPLFWLRWTTALQEPQPNPDHIREVGQDVAITLQHHELVTLPTGMQKLTLRYAVVATSGAEDGRKATATIHLQLASGSNVLRMSLDVVNNSSSDTIYETVFPVISNVCIEKDANNESLLYPFFSGTKLSAPRDAILRSKQMPDLASPLAPSFSPNGATIRHLYSGRLSMPWMAVTGCKHGVALVHLDERFDVSALAVYASVPEVERSMAGEALGPHDATGAKGASVSGGIEPGPAGEALDQVTAAPASYLDLAVCKPKPIAPGIRQIGAPTEVITFTGTWHQVADHYRTWAKRFMLPPRVPKWVRDSHALTAHYDFKWQDGTYTHTFADIPELYRRSAREGIDHIFMAGWFTGGFDHMYPEFYPDLQLGTVMDFIDAVRTVRAEGGKPTFYINTSLFGKASRYYSTLGMDWAVKGPNGEPIERKFFDGYFNISCRGVHAYQRHMRDTVRWLVGEVGALGVYLDTFAAIGPHLCFDPTHGHPHPAHWNRDALATLRMVEDAVRQVNPDAFTMFEGCSDIYGQWIVAHLIHGWAYLHSYPEMFHYTFPEYVLVDMVYPSKGQSFRPQRISDQAYDQLHRTWANGCILWTYDQEDTRFCNFRNDPEMWQYIKKLLQLREAGNGFFSYGIFRDTVGVQASGSTVVKRYTRAQESAGDGAGVEGGADVKSGAQAHNDAIEMLAVWSPSKQVEPFLVEQWLVEEWRQQLGKEPQLISLTVDGQEQALALTPVRAVVGAEVEVEALATAPAVTGYMVQPLATTAQVMWVKPGVV